MINITSFETKISPKLHGTTLAKLGGSFYDKLHEAAGNMLGKVRPYSVIRSARIENAIYDQVFNYAVEDDVEADAIIDIRPIGERSRGDAVGGTFLQEFDIKKEENTFTIEYINGQKTLRLSKCLNPRTVLATLDTLTGPTGTVVGSGDVEDLELDYLDYVSGSASAKFGLSGVTGQGKITISLPATVDLRTLEGIGALFSWLKFPDATRLTNVKLRVGSSASDYVTMTTTAAHDRAFESNAWLLLRHLLLNGTTTGTPDFSAIDWVEVEINYVLGGALTEVHLDNITAALGQAWEVVYYSNRLFTDSTGLVWKEIPTAKTDIIRLESGLDLNVFTYEVMVALQQELKGKNAAGDLKYFMNQLGSPDVGTGLYGKLARKYPDQAIVRTTTYAEFDELDGYGN